MNCCENNKILPLDTIAEDIKNIDNYLKTLLPDKKLDYDTDHLYEEDRRKLGINKKKRGYDVTMISWRTIGSKNAIEISIKPTNQPRKTFIEYIRQGITNFTQRCDNNTL